MIEKTYVYDFRFYLMRIRECIQNIGNLIFINILVCLMLIFTSCEGRMTLDSDSPISVVGELTNPAEEHRATTDNSSVVFTGSDIQWFNPESREIVFKKEFDITTFHTYQKNYFNLNGRFLFTAETYASQYHSFAIKDLVLFIDIFTRKCYLNDCYPLALLENDSDTKKNRDKRANAWNSFLKQLKAENKIK